MKIILAVLMCALVSGDNINEEFRKHEIVPKIISVAPRNLLEVVYPENTKLSPGKELTPTAVKDEPQVTWVAEPNAKYTLVMSDPDAASINGFLHWLVGNINGADVHSGEAISEYIGSGPPRGSGLHRYIFTVYKQNGEVNFKEPYAANNSAVGRGGFSDKKFAEKYNLGNPVAGNFYLAQYDDYVPILHSRFMKPTTPKPTVISVRTVPEYIESSTVTNPPQTFDVDIPSHHDIKAAFISDDKVVHSKVLHQADTVTSTEGVEFSADGRIFILPILDTSAVTTSSEPTVSTPTENEQEVATETVPHHGTIIGAYKLNDSVLHTKVLNEEEILHHKTDTFDTTDATVPHEGDAKVAFVSEETLMQIKGKQSHLKDSVAAETSKVEDSSTHRGETVTEERSTRVTTFADGTTVTTIIESSSPIPVELSNNVEAFQSTERSEPSATPETVTSTPPTYEVKTTISISTGKGPTVKEDAATYDVPQVSEL